MLVLGIAMHHIHSITMIVIDSKMGGVINLGMAGHTMVTYLLGYAYTFTNM